MTIGISSDQLEALGDRIRKLDGSLSKLKGAEVRAASVITEAASVAREWIRHSQQLRERGVFSLPTLEKYDSSMSELLNATKARTRASSYKKKLATFLSAFNDEIVIPTIKHEGSPEQAAARQLYALLAPHLTPDESAYVEEAARCATMRCYRAALVLLWAAGIARIHNAVERVGFDAYNKALKAAAAKKGYPFAKLSQAEITSQPELQKTRDFDLLIVGMGLWGYDLQVFQELERLLEIRNSAAHPGMFQPSPLDVQQFATKLDDYVFQNVKP